MAAQSGVTGAGGSFAPAFSTDGRFLVFVSHAHNLVTNDAPSPNLDVFVRDLAARRTVLARVSTNGLGGANADANYPSISSSGRFVAFASAAGNLVPNDTNRASDIFVRDLVAGTTTLVSADTSGAAPRVSPVGSTHPLISADGRWVFFESLATSLVTNLDGIESRDVFARDLQSGATRLISVKQSGAAGVNSAEDSTLRSISPNGRFAAFVSKAPNLVAGVATGAAELYVRDLQNGVTSWASTNVVGFSGFPPSYAVLNAVLSADGRIVVFKAASSLVATQASVFRHDLQTGGTERLASFSRSDSWPGLSADGRFVASEEGVSNRAACDVFIRDALAGTNLLVGVSNNPVPLTGVSRSPVLTPDGRSVAFLRDDAAPTFTASLYVADLAANTTRLASVTADGLAARVPGTVVPALSLDGLCAAFHSDWDGWVTNDLNRASDVFVRDLVAGTTELVSERQVERPARTGFGPSIASPNCQSADGRWLAFSSSDSTLVSGDTNNWADVFIRDLVNGTNRIVLWQTSSVGPPILSGNGQYVAYVRATDAANQTGLGTGPWSGAILWHDLGTGSSRAITVTRDGMTESSGRASAPAISFDGRLVAFESTGLDLIGSGISTSTYANIYVRDLAARMTYLISTNQDPRSSLSYGDNVSSAPAFTPDARWLLFQSRARNIASNYLTSSSAELFACEWRMFTGFYITNYTNYAFGPPRQISRTATEPLGCVGAAAISANSRFAAFASVWNTNLTASQGVYVHDFQTSLTTLAASNATAPALSGDGRYVVFQTAQPGSMNPFTNQVMLSDTTTGALELMSVNRAGPGGGNGNSTAPLITPDGRYVVFVSKASDLVANDANGLADIFVRDRATSNTFAITLSIRTGGTGGGFAGVPMLGADGRTVLFHSFAGDLVPGDYNDKRDVFVLRLGAPDSDGDGLDDDWEMAHFSTLARDGTGDFDGDGASDLQEFRAGTDPTNNGSVFRALTLTSLGGAGTTILWAAVPGKSYRVQFKNDLNDAAWTDLPGAIVWNGSTASMLDTTAGATGRRFYRVIVVP